MKIKVRSAITLLGIGVSAGIVLAAAAGAFVFYKVSIGGAVYNEIVEGKDLVADILPPPEYVIEAYLEATLAAHNLQDAGTTEEHLRSLHKDYDERRAVWQKSNLPESLRDKLTQKSDAKVQLFWKAVEKDLLPALKRGDKAAVEKAYAAAANAYREHRLVIDEIVKEANDMNTAIEAAATSQIRIMMYVMGGILFTLLSALIAGFVMINRGVISPVLRITGVLTAIAGGHTDVEVPGTSRGDEIGTMANATQSLRDSLIENAQRQAEAAERDRQAAAETAAVKEAAMRELDAAVGGIVAAAMDGDFTQRVPLDGKEGVIRNLAAALNAMCNNIGQVLDDLVHMMSALAQGDLSQRIMSNYRGKFSTLKDSANGTAERLSEIMTGINSAVVEVTNAAGEVAASTSDLSQRTEEQATSLEQTSASLNEISTTVKNNADHAKEADSLTTSTRQAAEQGGKVAASAVQAMARIEDSAGKIAEIISVIDEIARQTNLLALNAAVEAARAGEAGRGFAVVASEVRSLAQRSAQAAKDIKDLITNSNAQVKEGVDLVNRAGGALNEIVSSIKTIADIVGGIATASAEQSTGLDHVNKAMSQMDEGTQQNSALVEQNAATAKALEAQAEGIRTRIAFFKLDNAPDAKPAGAPAPAAVEKPAPAAGKPAAPRPAARPAARTQGALALKNDWQEF